jgi:hypothetical protein
MVRRDGLSVAKAPSLLEVQVMAGHGSVDTTEKFMIS